jgi:hypothetical protein
VRQLVVIDVGALGIPEPDTLDVPDRAFDVR